MRRRDFIGAIYCAAIALPLGAAAQQPGKVWRIGHILPAGNKEYPEALEQRLADLGYVQGRNIALLNRFPGTQPDKIEEAIVSLLPQIDLLVIWGSIAGMAAIGWARSFDDLVDLRGGGRSHFGAVGAEAHQSAIFRSSNPQNSS